jgi:sporulation protein YhbH
MNDTRYVLVQDTWDLYRKAEEDEKRHRARIQEALRKNLVDLVTEESIVVADGRRVVRVPVQTVQEFRFRFGPAPPPGGEGRAGSGGMVRPAAGGPASGHEGGNAPGLDDFRETEITLEQADSLLFEGLCLPDWDPARRDRGGDGGHAWEDLRRSGPRATLARRPTLKAALAHPGGPSGRIAIRPEDLRFRALAASAREEAGAVVLAMMDTSGSMGTFEKYMARSFFFWAVRFLRTRYPRVEIVFLAHDVRAREVDEDAFFHRGASGGTVSSSVYRLAATVLADRYPVERYNAYAFHFTDGGNLTSDNPAALEAGARLAERVNLFGYGEIHDTVRHPSPLFAGFAQLERARTVVLRQKADVFRALSVFFAAAKSPPEEVG